MTPIYIDDHDNADWIKRRPLTAAANEDHSDSSIVAWTPSVEEADKLSLPGGETSDHLHCTLVYLGPSEAVPDSVPDLVAAVAARFSPFVARVQGTAIFNTDEGDVLVRLLDAPELEQLQQRLHDEIAAVTDIPDSHGFTAHVTLKYLAPDEDIDPSWFKLAPMDVKIESITTDFGMDSTDYPLATEVSLGDHDGHPFRGNQFSKVLGDDKEDVVPGMSKKDEKKVAKMFGKIDFGDSAGHAFHGNQYTGGIGGMDVDKFVADHPRLPGEEVFVWQARIVAGLPDEVQNQLIFKTREYYPPVDYLAAGIDRWCVEHGLPPLPENCRDIPCDLSEADVVARYFEDTPDQAGDPRVAAAYEDFKAQSAEQYDFLTKPESEGGLGVKIEFTDKVDPYATAEAQAEDLRENHHMWTQSGLGGAHEATMTQDEYDRFRAVHDVFGHAGIGGGFDRHGEYEAWLAHATMYTGIGRAAMSTEYHGANSALWSGEKGTPGTGKSLLLPDELANPPWDRGSLTASASSVKEDQLIVALGLDAHWATLYSDAPWHVKDGKIIASVQPLEFGDLAGHVFHGNQWTTGEGGAEPVAGNLHHARTVLSHLVRFGDRGADKGLLKMSTGLSKEEVHNVLTALMEKKVVEKSDIGRYRWTGSLPPEMTPTPYVVGVKDITIDNPVEPNWWNRNAGKDIPGGYNPQVTGYMGDSLAWLPASAALEIEFGDTPGHEFHGNQWTEGTGSTDTLKDELKSWSAQFPKGTVYRAMHKDDLARVQRTGTLNSAFPDGQVYGSPNTLGMHSYLNRNEVAVAYRVDPSERQGVGAKPYVQTMSLPADRIVGVFDPKEAVAETIQSVYRGDLGVEFGDVSGHHFHGNQYVDYPSADQLSKVDDIYEQSPIGSIAIDPLKTCYETSAKIEKKLGWEQRGGYYEGEGHYWNIMPSGTIVDASFDQFDEDEPIHIVKTDDPDYNSYKPDSSVTASIRLEFGDTEGHHFHGNQWTGGLGGLDAADAQEMMAALPTKSRYNEGGPEAIDKWEQENADKGAHIYRKMLDSWSGEGSAAMSRMSSKSDIEKMAAEEPNNDARQDANALRQFMDKAPTTDEPIYRGASALDLKPGFRFDLPPSSFSESEGVARNHAMLGEKNPSVIEIQGGHRSLPVGGLSRYPEETESIAAGKYEVVSASHQTADVYGRMVDYQHVIVKQVG